MIRGTSFRRSLYPTQSDVDKVRTPSARDLMWKSSSTRTLNRDQRRYEREQSSRTLALLETSSNGTTVTTSTSTSSGQQSPGSIGPSDSKAFSPRDSLSPLSSTTSHRTTTATRSSPPDFFSTSFYSKRSNRTPLGSTEVQRPSAGAVVVSSERPTIAERSVSVRSTRTETTKGMVRGISSSSFRIPPRNKEMYPPRHQPHHSTSTNTSTTSSTKPPTRKEIEVSPGFFLPLHGTQETVEAIKKNRMASATCSHCEAALYCTEQAAYVLCPVCKNMSPIQIHGTGVGLGIQSSDYHKWRRQL